MHLDHFQDVALTDEAIRTAGELGVTSIMVDAAHLPYAKNVERTRAFVKAAHEAGLWVEAELGEIGGKGNAHDFGVRTDPGEAVAFAELTGVDGLAVAVGSSHAMTTRDARLDIELIEKLAARVAVPLVLHGSSGVPDDCAARGRPCRDPQGQRRDGAQRRPHRRDTRGARGRPHHHRPAQVSDGRTPGHRRHAWPPSAARSQPQPAVDVAERDAQ